MRPALMPEMMEQLEIPEDEDLKAAPCSAPLPASSVSLSGSPVVHLRAHHARL